MKLLGRSYSNIKKIAFGDHIVNSYDLKLFSECVCNPCKIRNLGTLYELVQNSIGGQAAYKTPPKQNINVSKRLLDTPPGSSPFRKTVRVYSPSPASQKSFQKSLQFATTAEQDAKDCVESKLNIDDLPIDGTLQVKAVIGNSTGQVTTRIPHKEQTKQIVQQLCNKNWQAAANTILKQARSCESTEKEMFQKKWLATLNPKVFCS